MSLYLVTGGAGFIGSHIVQALIKQRHKVRVLDNFFTGKIGNLSFFKNYRLSTADYQLIRGDIRDLKTCHKACRGADYVLHQAALRSVPKSVKYPLEYNEVNVEGTLNILLAARDEGVKRVVFASSSSVYGDARIFPQKEEFLPLPISPYAVSKLCGEYYCRMFSIIYGLETVSLRYFNVFGPRQSLESQYAVVIPKFINSILNNEKPPIYGNGRQSRDFTFIDNVVKANLLAARARNAGGEVFNIASGKDYSVLDLLSYLNRISGKKISPHFISPRPGDVMRTWADISKAKKLLGFTPEVSFKEGLERTFAWFKENRVINK